MQLKKIVGWGLLIGGLLASVMTSRTPADELNVDPELREEANLYAQDLVSEWAGARNPDTILQLLAGLHEYGPASHSTEASLVPVLVGIVDDTTDFTESPQYLAVSQLYAMEISTADAVSAFEACLGCTDRMLSRLVAGVSLVRLGYVQEALPIVEEYAQDMWQPPDSLDSLGIGDEADPVSAFLLPPDDTPLRLSDPVAEDSLNAYFVRVLAYPDTFGRIDAIDFLLQKGVAVEQALQAAQDLLEHLEPGPYQYADQHNLVYILDTFGGEAGKAIAKPYEQ